MKRRFLCTLLAAAGTITVITGIVGMFAFPTLAFAQQSSSTNYQINEAFFGTGGQLCEPGVSGNSTNYCAKSAVGETAVGNTSSTNYQAQGGFNTNRSESLDLAVNDSQCPDFGSATQDLGYLDTSTAKTAVINFSVKSYLATGGYVVNTVGASPVNGAVAPHNLTPLTSGGTTSPGTEQFGINLRANSSPSIGSDASQLPDSTFGFGQASTGYNTVNNFRYNNGDNIANSTKSSGTTCYTISYLFNISGVTPAGKYTFNQSIVATSTF